MTSMKKRIISIGLFWLIGICGCAQQDIKPEPLAEGCYKGVALADACPSYLMVQVIGAPIGTPWEGGGKAYDNVVTIANAHAFATATVSLSRGDTVYFKADLTTLGNPSGCKKIAPCPAVLIDPPVSKVIFCASLISNADCSNP
jgi:hypothetical protein